jgi:putative copper export protein
MSTMMKDQDTLRREARYFKVGWVLLAVAVLAVATTILATAATPHVLWLFSTSYGAVLLVVGVALIRVGHSARVAQCDGSAGLEGCRT